MSKRCNYKTTIVNGSITIAPADSTHKTSRYAKEVDSKGYKKNGKKGY